MMGLVPLQQDPHRKPAPSLSLPVRTVRKPLCANQEETPHLKNELTP